VEIAQSVDLVHVHGNLQDPIARSALKGTLEPTVGHFATRTTLVLHMELAIKRTDNAFVAKDTLLPPALNAHQITHLIQIAKLRQRKN